MHFIFVLCFVFFLPALGRCGPAVDKTKHSLSSEDSTGGGKSTTSNDNSNISDLQQIIVKREISDADHHPHSMIMLKKSATVLNKLMYALRNTFDKSGPPTNGNEYVGSEKENDSFQGVGHNPGAANANYDPFPTLQRRGQKDRKIYLRCYFNAVSCFKK